METDKPQLAGWVSEQIEQDFHEIDQGYWKELGEMQRPTEVAELLVSVERLRCGIPQAPRPPKLPQKLSVVLVRYAQELFHAEASQYPLADPQLRHWLERLAARTSERVLQQVRELDRRSLLKKLAFHGLSESQMREEIDDALRQVVDQWFEQHYVQHENEGGDDKHKQQPPADAIINHPGKDLPSRQRGPDTENQPVRECPPAAAHARTVAPGVAQVLLADLNVPVATTVKQTKKELRKLGAPSRDLKDSRVLEAADYKRENPNSTYIEVSRKFFGTTERADSIRYWVNRRKSSDGRE
jgi:hypothetical protein